MANKRANGEGSVCQTKDGRWVASRTQASGKRTVFYRKTRKEVSSKRTDALKKREDGLPTLSGRLTVGRFLLDLLDAVKPGLRPRNFFSLRTGLPPPPDAISR